jgi:putative two-component system response regulator
MTTSAFLDSAAKAMGTASNLFPFNSSFATSGALASDTAGEVPKILIVDDEELNIRVARKYLRGAGFTQVASTTDPAETLDVAHREQPDLILLDVMMPNVSGLDVLQSLRSDFSMAHVPVIILTAHLEDDIRYKALSLGANDFLTKPIDPLELLPRVRNLAALRQHQKSLERTAEHLELEVRRRTQALIAAQHHVIHCLARAAEFRDNDTGRHIVRVGLYSALIARALGFDKDYAEMIEQAAKLHDVGKIGIPDSILLKAGALDPSEYAMMRGHCQLGLHVIEEQSAETDSLFRSHVEIGAEILNVDSPLLSMASQIAMTHHERWDGTGYPLGLKGDQIPLEGRIVAVADVFDALSMQRPYKPAFPLERCFAILKEGRGTHFDPAVLDAFLANHLDAAAIQMQHSDLLS